MDNNIIINAILLIQIAAALTLHTLLKPPRYPPLWANDGRNTTQRIITFNIIVTTFLNSGALHLFAAVVVVLITGHLLTTLSLQTLSMNQRTMNKRTEDTKHGPPDNPRP